MEVLQAQVIDPKSTLDYKKTTFEFDAKDVHPIVQMDIHRQTREMMYYTQTSNVMTSSKLKVSLTNIQSQLKQKNVSYLAKDNKIKSLESLESTSKRSGVERAEKKT